MRTWLTILLLLSGFSFAQAQVNQEGQPDGPMAEEAVPFESTDAYDIYGDEWMPTGEQLDILTAMEKMMDYAGEEMHIVGTITKVCQEVGCWVTLSDDGQHIRVRLQEENFVIPQGAVGHKAEIIGLLAEDEMGAQLDDAPPTDSMGFKEFAVIARSVKVYK